MPEAQTYTVLGPEGVAAKRIGLGEAQALAARIEANGYEAEVKTDKKAGTDFDSAMQANRATRERRRDPFAPLAGTVAAEPAAGGGVEGFDFERLSSDELDSIAEKMDVDDYPKSGSKKEKVAALEARFSG